MGFLGLAPADGVAATYAPGEQTLTLYARGQALNFTYGFQFKRLTWLGGLKFELLAWSGPHASGSREYHHSQKFDIANLKVVDPDDSVDIVTSDHPYGQLIPVRWLGVEPKNAILDPFLGSFSKPSQRAAADSPQVLDADIVTMNVLFNEKFTIKEPTTSSTTGYVQAQHSQFALTIENAGIEFDNLVWTFNSLETGQTQVVINTSSDFGGFINRKVYNINVYVLENSLIAGDALSGTAKGPLRAILDFAGRVNVALGIVKRTAPEAQLLSAQANLPHGVPYPMKDPLRLSQLECIFRTDAGVAKIRSTGWGEFEPPVFMPDEIIRMSVISLDQIAVDVVPAVDALRSAGIGLAFWDVSLEHPLVAPGKLHEEPYYVFHLVDGSYVFVGAKEREVIVNRTGEMMFPAARSTG
ncbi:MAG: hypothetical protein LQ343_005112 [Gyalolechia ehrenbergii]|nr:MAG: hypothetical protein LQ343_005112 [Gyalolechia ehrenbergii]